MSVVKRKRKESPFEVFHHLIKMRKDITDLLLRDFGYSNEKFQKKMEKWYGGKPPDQLTDVQKQNIERQKRRAEAFDEWFKSWLCGYAKYMSKEQRKNIYELSAKLKTKHKNERTG